MFLTSSWSYRHSCNDTNVYQIAVLLLGTFSGSVFSWVGLGHKF